MKKFLAKLERAVQLNHDVFQYDFRYEGEHVDFLAGQFFMLEVPTGERKITRSYSVSSEPVADNTFSLCVKLIPEGLGSTLLKNLKPGDEASFMAPFGHFVIKDNAKDMVLVATGTGLAPYISMLPHLFKAGVTKPITLYFGVRHEEDLFYVELLRTWEKEHSNFHAVITLSQPTESWTGDKGRVTEHLSGLNFGNSTVYICGNGDMVKSVRDLLLDRGVAKEDICLEQFTPLK
jgi:ferredoxin-NADP reductase